MERRVRHLPFLEVACVACECLASALVPYECLAVGASACGRVRVASACGECAVCECGVASERGRLRCALLAICLAICLNPSPTLAGPTWI